jgi:hypothetical protein
MERAGGSGREGKFAILFAASLLCARKPMEIEEEPSPARMSTVDKAIRNAAIFSTKSTKVANQKLRELRSGSYFGDGTGTAERSAERMCARSDRLLKPAQMICFYLVKFPPRHLRSESRVNSVEIIVLNRDCPTRVPPPPSGTPIPKSNLSSSVLYRLPVDSCLPL